MTMKINRNGRTIKQTESSEKKKTQTHTLAQKETGKKQKHSY